MKALNDAHQAEYEVPPEVAAKAPGRFHLIGEHSWFFKDKTLSMAINLPVYVGISRRDDSTIKFYFKQLNERKRANITSLKYKKEDRWANAVKAIVYGFQSGGFNLGGMNVTIYSEILPSAGFGITTAIKCAAAIAIKELFQVPCNEVQLLQVIERGNKLFLLQNNYAADNFTALYARDGSLLLTDHHKNNWDYVPMDFEDKSIILVDTKVPRINVWNEESLFEPENALILGDLKETKQNVYGGWRYTNNITDINESLDAAGNEDVHRRLMCMIREHGDVLEAKDGAEKNDFFKFARAVNHSHESMRDLYNISCPEIEWILKRVSELEPNLQLLRNPVSCGRITGKGFGRCLYVIIRKTDVNKFIEKLGDFEKIFGYKPAYYEVKPSSGAVIVKD